MRGFFSKGVDALANLKQPFFLGDPVDMVTPRSIYNDVYSPKIGFPYLLGWNQSQKTHCIVL